MHAHLTAILCFDDRTPATPDSRPSRNRSARMFRTVRAAGLPGTLCIPVSRVYCTCAVPYLVAVNDLSDYGERSHQRLFYLRAQKQQR